MLAYILGITKWGSKGITNRDRFYGLQIESRGITTTRSLTDFKSGQKYYKSGQGFQIGAIDITNRGRNFKSRQGLQIGAEHRKRNISLVFIKQSYFPMPKDVRLNSKHYLIMKIHNKIQTY